MSGVAGRRAVDTERVKLTANALDRASTASLTVGVFAPLAASLYAGSGPHVPVLLLGAGAWVMAAIVLHLTARWVLGRLPP